MDTIRRYPFLVTVRLVSPDGSQTQEIEVEAADKSVAIIKAQVLTHRANPSVRVVEVLSVVPIER